MAEHHTCNMIVGGSIPLLGFLKKLYLLAQG
jgi:hypothetical protein